MNEHALSRESALYEPRKAEYERVHHWEWVIIHGDEVVGSYSDFQVAAEIAVDRFGRGAYILRQIGVPKPTLPASVLVHPIYADH